METVAMAEQYTNLMLNHPNSKTLRRWRVERGLSQVKLAARADVGLATIESIERSGGMDPDADWKPSTMRKVAQALGVGVMDIVDFRVALGYPA